MESNLPMDLYKVFNIVAETGNITKASKLLYISQPAVSKTICKLEQELHTTLFTRSSRGVKLTEEGKILYEYTSAAFSKLKEGETVIKKINTLDMGHLKIGTSTTLCKYILLPYLKDFVHLYPHINLTIQCQSSSHTLSLLSEGKADIGLIGKPDHLNGFEFIPIMKIEDIFVATPRYLNHLKYREHLERAPEQLTGADFEQYIASGNLMLLDEENMTRQYLDNFFYKFNIKTEHILEVSTMDLLIEFAKIGLGIACVVRSFVEQELANGTFISLPLNHPIKKREIGFAYSTKHPCSKSLHKFVDFCKTSSNPISN